MRADRVVALASLVAFTAPSPVSPTTEHPMREGYAAYHAECWAEHKNAEQIREEIVACSVPHEYTWNQVGSPELQRARVETLTAILAERASRVADRASAVEKVAA
jgi:hypothetical protein